MISVFSMECNSNPKTLFFNNQKIDKSLRLSINHSAVALSVAVRRKKNIETINLQ